MAENGKVLQLDLLYKELSVKGGKCGVTFDSIANKLTKNVTEETLQNWIGSSDTKVQQAAHLFLQKWAKEVLAKKKAVVTDRGHSPKVYAPPKTEKLVTDSEWEIVGLPSNHDRRYILGLHNEWRKKYNTKPISSYSFKLEPHAQAWANYLLSKSKFEHNTESRVAHGLEGNTGENLSEFSSNGSAPESWNNYHKIAVNGWGNEDKDYDFEQHKAKKFGKMVGHFTQLIWKATTRVGCGFAVAKTKDGWWRAVWVCNYHPAGNVTGQYADNIGKKI